MRVLRAGALTLLAVILAVMPAQSVPAAQETGHGGFGGWWPRGARTWVGTWATAPTTVPESNDTVFEDQTIRQIVHVSVGGGAVRVRLSNEFGTEPLVIGEARIAPPAPGTSGPDIDRGSDRKLTFGGRSAVKIPAGAPMLSDPVRLRVPADSNLVVSHYLPQRTPATTIHASSFQENFVASGNVTARPRIEPSSTIEQWYFLSGVSVRTKHPHAASIVALGDSITDGANTTVGANHRWPDLLADRLQSTHHLDHLGVLNKGSSGNRLLHDPNPPPGSDAESFAAYFGESGLRRFDRDVLAQPGVRYVIVLLGVNDLGHPGTVAPESETVSAEEIIAGHRQLIARAHQQGLKIAGATITPFRGDTFGFYTPENEAARQAVNHWIRTSGEYDAVIDFDAALRDPDQPDRLLPAYDSGDHLHPGDTGMEAMARAVPLKIFRWYRAPVHPGDAGSPFVPRDLTLARDVGPARLRGPCGCARAWFAVTARTWSGPPFSS